MGTFMAANKTVIVKSISQKLAIELDIATTLSFHIYERVQGTPLTTIDYRVSKVSGRTSSEIQGWTSISLVGVEDDIYVFDVTLSAVTASDKLTLEFKVVDVDGVESFHTTNDISVIE